MNCLIFILFLLLLAQKYTISPLYFRRNTLLLQYVTLRIFPEYQFADLSGRSKNPLGRSFPKGFLVVTRSSRYWPDHANPQSCGRYSPTWAMDLSEVVTFAFGVDIKGKCYTHHGHKLRLFSLREAQFVYMTFSF
jgi:hypothetical protein